MSMVRSQKLWYKYFCVTLMVDQPGIKQPFSLCNVKARGCQPFALFLALRSHRFLWIKLYFVPWGSKCIFTFFMALHWAQPCFKFRTGSVTTSHDFTAILAGRACRSSLLQISSGDIYLELNALDTADVSFNHNIVGSDWCHWSVVLAANYEISQEIRRWSSDIEGPYKLVTP